MWVYSLWESKQLGSSFFERGGLKAPIMLVWVHIMMLENCEHLKPGSQHDAGAMSIASIIGKYFSTCQTSWYQFFWQPNWLYAEHWWCNTELEIYSIPASPHSSQHYAGTSNILWTRLYYLLLLLLLLLLLALWLLLLLSPFSLHSFYFFISLFSV